MIDTLIPFGGAFEIKKGWESQVALFTITFDQHIHSPYELPIRQTT